jgi:hypothetical protein
MQTSTLRPGLLVSLKTSVRGNVAYQRRDILTDASHSKWETDRVIADPVEHEAATKARNAARSAITKVCTTSAFGLLCPEAKAEQLEDAIKEARRITDAFNASATLSRVSVYVICVKVASDDVEAVKSITSEVRDLLEAMESGLKNLDVKAIRQAAGKAKEVGTMLAPEAAARVQIAVDVARKAARDIVSAGEQAAIEVDLASIRRVTEMRTSFLDLDEVNEIARPAERVRGVDLVNNTR